MTNRRRPRLVALGLAVVASLTLAGCSGGNDYLAEQYQAGTGNYIKGDGRVTEIAVENRGDPIEFTGILEDGSTVTSEEYAGKVLVVNTWYAGCPPCRAEAPDLEAVYEEFKPQGVDFLGINVRDQATTARAFESAFGVTYPTTLDAETGSMRLAFSGEVAPNAVPITLVLDKQGRVASRILGKLPDASVLKALLVSALAEDASSAP